MSVDQVDEDRIGGEMGAHDAYVNTDHTEAADGVTACRCGGRSRARERFIIARRHEHSGSSNGKPGARTSSDAMRWRRRGRRGLE